jgi:hypothetical protein
MSARSEVQVFKDHQKWRALLGNIRVSGSVSLVQENLKGEKCVQVDLHFDCQLDAPYKK